MAAKRLPASQCGLEGVGDEEQLICPVLDQLLRDSEVQGITYVPGLMWQNETYTGAPPALPGDWPSVCWQGPRPGCGPDYANPQLRALIYRWIRAFGRRYDGKVPVIMANIGDDGERRFCKDVGAECWTAYMVAGLNSATWATYETTAYTTWEDAFSESFVAGHYSGFGFSSTEIGRAAATIDSLGMGLMTSGLYPGQCRGNSWGGVCNTVDPLNVDWMVPLVYTQTVFLAEQSWKYEGDMAALAWLWAVTHGAQQIHAQRETLASSVGQEWRETTEYMLAHPEAALWVARELDTSRCEAWYGIGGAYCGERGDWARNVIAATSSGLGWNVTTSYRGWVARRAPVVLTTTVEGPAEIRVMRPNGRLDVWVQPDGRSVMIEDDQYVHRVEVRPLEIPTATPTATATDTPSPTTTSTATPSPSPSSTGTATATATPTTTVTPTATPTPSPTPQDGWRIFGKIGDAVVDLWVVRIE